MKGKPRVIVNSETLAMMIVDYEAGMTLKQVGESYVEEDYQGYIDELHRQIDSLYEIINAQANKLDKYEDALLNVALKIGAER